MEKNQLSRKKDESIHCHGKWYSYKQTFNVFLFLWKAIFESLYSLLNRDCFQEQNEREDSEWERRKREKNDQMRNRWYVHRQEERGEESPWTSSNKLLISNFIKRIVVSLSNKFFISRRMLPRKDFILRRYRQMPLLYFVLDLIRCSRNSCPIYHRQARQFDGFRCRLSRMWSR